MVEKTHKKTGKLFDRTEHPVLSILDTAKIEFDVVSPRHVLDNLTLGPKRQYCR